MSMLNFHAKKWILPQKLQPNNVIQWLVVDTLIPVTKGYQLCNNKSDGYWTRSLETGSQIRHVINWPAFYLRLYAIHIFKFCYQKSEIISLTSLFQKFCDHQQKKLSTGWVINMSGDSPMWNWHLLQRDRIFPISKMPTSRIWTEPT